jgi:hypothetical protein
MGFGVCNAAAGFMFLARAASNVGGPVTEGQPGFTAVRRSQRASTDFHQVRCG